MGQRLNIWDFDDTLAWSVRAVEEFKRRYPEVESFRWWHDADWSTQAVLETMPVLEMWARLNKTPGTHWVLSGRNKSAIQEWMNLWRQHPDLGPVIRKISRIHSTSGGPFRHKDTAARKKKWVQDTVVGNWAEVHVYDDNKRNLAELDELGLITHLIRDGREVFQGDHHLWERVSSERVDKDLQVIYQSIKTLGEMEHLSEDATYSEVFRATLDTLKSLQNRILTGLSTLEVLELVVHQLAQTRISLGGDLSGIASQVEAGRHVEVEFRFDEVVEGISRSTRPEIERAVHSLGVQIEATFDRLSLPIVCAVNQRVMGGDKVTVGFLGTIWRMS